MPKCVCGLRVDRVFEALQCVICKGLYHPECCNIKLCEVEFIKEYKCKTCLEDRRMSSSPSSAPVVPVWCQTDSSRVSESAPLVALADDAASNINMNLDLSADCVTIDKSTVNEAINAVDNTIVNKTINEAVKMLSAEGSVKASSNLSNENNNVCLCNCSKNSCIDWSELFNVIKGLKLSNDCLVKNVQDLQIQNKELVSLVGSLKLELTKEIKKAISSSSNNSVINSSPKRKRINAATRSQASLVKSSVVADDTHLGDIAAKTTKNMPKDRANKVIGVNAAKIDLTNESAKQNSIPNNMVNDSDNGPNQKLSYAAVSSNAPLTQNNAVIQSNKGSSNIISNSSYNNDNWKLVANKKKKIVTGTNVSDDLEVFAKFRWLHLSSFRNSVTTDDIVKYISKESKVDSVNFSCVRLTKREANIKDLKFVNFKLGVTTGYYEQMFNPILWPANIKVRPFSFLEKKEEVKTPQPQQ